MIIGIDSIYIPQYHELFSKQEGKTYAVSLLSETLTKKYNKKVLIINLDHDRNKNIFEEHGIKQNTKTTINDFIEHFNYSVKARIPYNFSIDEILKNVLLVSKNLELLSVNTTDKVGNYNMNNIEYVKYANQIEETHLSNTTNLQFFFYILDIIRRSNIWDYILLDLSAYPNSEIFQDRIDFLINVLSIQTLLKVCFSEDRELISAFRDEITKDKTMYNHRVIINNVTRDVRNFMDLITFMGIEESRVLGYISQEKIFSSNARDIENIIHNINLMSNSNNYPNNNYNY